MLPQEDPDQSASSPATPGKGGKPLRIGLMGRVRAYFLAGILVTAPVAITLYLAWAVINLIDTAVSQLLPAQYNPENYLPFSIPGLGVVIVIVALTLTGALTAGVIGRLVVRAGEAVLARMPVVRSVYGATKQILETVLANQSAAFREVVLVEYPRRGIWTLGFITGHTQGEVQDLTVDDVVNVFIPTTPNPTSGFLLFVPRSDLHVLEMTVEEGIKMVVSGGIVTPPDRRPVTARRGSVEERSRAPETVE
ncbi:DUF502 domain-containing protein [Skermanella rosea]|uniref:DUF502 domain-containing protein n=1 Tax=Skermanella rosea TaxID=1817965 RepID=UPI003899D8EB